MILGQVLQGIVITVATQAHGGQHEDLPVGQAGTAPRGPRVLIHVLLDEPQESLAHLGLAIDVLQGHEDGDQFMAAVQLEGDALDRSRLPLIVGREGGTHGGAPLGW